MKAIKRQLSILLAVLMVISCINPYAIQVKADGKNPVEVLSEETGKAQTPDNDEASSEPLQEEKQEAVVETEKEAEASNKDAQVELAVRGKTQEELKSEAYTEDDFWVSGVSFNGLTPQGKEKLKAKNGVLEIPALKTSNGNDVSIIDTDKFKQLGIKQLTLPNTIKEIGSNAFYGNELKELSIPGSVKEIKPSAFARNQISNLILSEGLEMIFPYAFEYNQLKEVGIPDTVTEIRVGAFAHNTGDGTLENGQYGKVTLYINDISKVDFKFDPLGKDGYIIKPKSNGNLQEYVAADFTYFEDHHLGENAISIIGLSESGKAKQKTNHNLIIPDEIGGKKVLGIEKKAFLNQTQDKNIQFNSVKLPSYLIKIGDSAFAGHAVAEIKFPNTLEIIDNNAFLANELTNVLIPESVKVIGITAFRYNKITQGNAKIDNYKGNVRIDAEAFTDNGADGNTYVTPTYLKVKEDLSWKIDDFKFVDEPIPGTIDETGYPDVVYSLKGFSDKGLEKLKKNKNLVLPSKGEGDRTPVWIVDDAFKNQKIESVEIPGNYTHIQDRAFQGCGLKKVIFNEGLLYTNDNAFENNELTEITFPSTFIYPSKASFKGNKLVSITLPDACESIGPESFMNNQLSKVVMGSKVHIIYKQAFANNQLKEVNIPKSLKNKYQGLDGIKADAFDSNPGKANPLKPSENKVLLWTPNRDNPNNLLSRGNYVVDPVQANNEYQPDDFTYNSDNEVEGFSKKGSNKFDKMKDKPVVLPSKTDKGALVVGIAELGFNDDAVYIKNIVIPEGYKKIGDQAFSNSEIEKIDAPSTLQEIGDYSFLQSTNVVKIHVTKTVAKRITNTSNYWKLVVDKEEPQQEQWTVEDFTYGEENAVKEDNNGTQTPIKLKAVTGFSAKGLEKVKTVKDLVLPTKNDKGEKIEAVADAAFKGNLGEKRINTLTIPEGYVLIGSMAFALNSCGGDLVLPDSLEAVGMGAFFRNEFTSLTTGEKLTKIPASMMFGNRLTKVTFKGNIESIGRIAFRENRLTEIRIPDSLKSIEFEAFIKNTGVAKYDEKVVLRTASGNNPQKLPDKENYIVDPSNQGTDPNINYNEWTTDDFEYNGTKVNGFSEQGLKKIKRNKNLVVPDKTPDGKSVLVIGIDAFRSLETNYEIETVKLPDTVEKIENYALQFNDIEKVTLPRDLKKLGWGVFMNNKLTTVQFNNKLEHIDQICFFNSNLGAIELPASVHTIGNAAFRQSGLTEVKFAEGSKLKTIESLAFADNELVSIDLPKGLEKIGSQAFGNRQAGIGNKFTELNVPASLKEIGFQAFANNPGVAKYKAVVIHTPDGKNPAGLIDDAGKTFVIDPDVSVTAEDKAKLKAEIDKAENVDSNKLTKEFQKFFTGVLDDAKAAYKDNKASKAKVLGLVSDLNWAVKRAKLNGFMFEKEALDSQSSGFDKKKWGQVEEAYKAAKKYLMVVNITDEKLNKLIHDLDIALQNLSGQGDLKDADVYEGEAHVEKTHYIKPYDIKVKVWVKNGKIVFVKDNGTVCDDPNDHEEHNRGYFEHAIEILHKYIGKGVDVVKNSKLGSNDLNIKAISGATISSHALHNAIKNALKKTDLSSSKWTVDDFTYGKMKAVKLENDGTQTPIELNAVTGFSAKGLEKVKTVKDLVLPTKNNNGETIEAVDNGAFKGTYGKPRFDSLTIPEGYKFIGVMAFVFNGFKGALDLPETVEAVDMAAFFGNEFTSLTTPTKLTVIPVSMMRRNKLQKVTFNGKISTISYLAFAENELKEVNIPDSLKKIDNVKGGAFWINPGSAKHDDKVVLWTPDKNNPNKLEDTKDYVIDPKSETSEEIDYSKWEIKDFEYAGQTIKGFSKTGLRKIKRNKNLEIPEKTPDGKPLLKVGIHAFRNLQTGYDIESVSIPDTVEEIENYALQFNHLTKVKLPRDLKNLRWGVFMNNKLTDVDFNDKLEYIDKLCFANNKLGKLELPRSVTNVMGAAFRQCDLTEVKFAEGSQLKEIGNLAFADNKLVSIDLPEGLEIIDRQAFGNNKPGTGNKFTELNVPASLKEIGYQAFANNPGVAKYKAVVIHTPDKKNPGGLVDDTGKTFVIDPDVSATAEHKAKLKAEIDKAEKVDSNKLTKDFKEFFTRVLNDAKAAYKDNKASKARVLGLVIDLSWAVKRSELSRLMFEKEALNSQSAGFDNERWGQVEEAYKSAKKYLMVINITNEKLDKLINDLDIALQNLSGQGDLKDALIYEGEAHVGKTIYVTPYDVKVKVWVKDGKIVFVKDNGTVCDDPSDHEEHNRGYFEHAIEILRKYIGKGVDLVKNNGLGSKDLNINAISGATMTSNALHDAIKNALGKAPINPKPPVNPNPPTPQTPDPSANPEDFIEPLDGGSSSGDYGNSIGGTANTETIIKDDKAPLAGLPSDKKALILKDKKKIKLTDKQLSDVTAGQYTHMELTVGDVLLKIMPNDLKPFFKKAKGKSYLKISRLAEMEMKRLNLGKNISKQAAYKVELVISGEKVTSLRNKISVQITHTGEIKRTTVKIFSVETGKTIKAKYNKKTDNIAYKTNELGIFAIMN